MTARNSETAAFAFVEKIQPLTTPEAVLVAFRKEAGRHGFSTVVVGALPRPDGSLPEFFLSTWSPEFVEEYFAERLALTDPSVDAARTAIRPVLWSDLHARYRAEGRTTRHFDLTRSNGFPEGFAIPVHGPNGYHGLVTVAGETADLSPRSVTALHLMSLYLHQRLMELMAPELMLPPDDLPRLSPGEVECIKWLIAGKSDWEMSEILNIAEATAHWRIERAKQKFGVKTRAQLTALAVHYGFVRP